MLRIIYRDSLSDKQIITSRIETLWKTERFNMDLIKGYMYGVNYNQAHSVSLKDFRKPAPLATIQNGVHLVCLVCNVAHCIL